MTTTPTTDHTPTPARKYRVVARRTAVYEIDGATSAQNAIDRMIDGEGKEVDGSTEEISAVRLCPECEEPLNATTQDAHDDGNYCDTCDREVDG